jgi:hypothetical protein
MSSKVIVYTRADGGVSVVRPAPASRLDGEAENDWLARVTAKAVPMDASNVGIVDASTLPPERNFRAAWTVAGREVTVDIIKARDVQRDKMRRARTSKMETLDADYMRAMERGDQAAMRTIASRKQELRDVTSLPEIEAARTPAQLAAFWPQCLN